jgi:plasmid stabilization system protein ParE
MKYRVLVQPRAWTEVEEAYRWIAKRSPKRAATWFNGLQTAITSLETYPGRCAPAPESDAFPDEVRQLLYGKRRGIYRILFVVRGESVHIFSIRHASRERLNPDDLGEPGE